MLIMTLYTGLLSLLFFAPMQKFLVLYMMPAAGLADWIKLPEEERKPMEEKMKIDWDRWAEEHKASLKETAGAGKTKRVSTQGIADVANDVMMYSFVEAASPEAAARLFVDHPHLAIPNAWIDIMPANPIS